MGKHKKVNCVKDCEPKTQYDINREKFMSLQNEWYTVKLGYLKSLDGEVKIEIERIYKQELDPKWLPNRYCSGCYFKAVQELINYFKL